MILLQLFILKLLFSSKINESTHVLQLNSDCELLISFKFIFHPERNEIQQNIYSLLGVHEAFCDTSIVH